MIARVEYRGCVFSIKSQLGTKQKGAFIEVCIYGECIYGELTVTIYIFNVYIYNTVSCRIFTVCFNLLFVKGVLRTVYKVLLYSIKYNKYAETRMQTVCKPYTIFYRASYGIKFTLCTIEIY